MTIEMDVEKILKNEGPCRPCEIREKLKQKVECKNYDDDRTLDVLIQRALVKLGDKVHREYGGRQRVFYSIKEEAKPQVENELYKYDMISEISTANLQQAKIPKEIIDKAWFDFEKILFAESTKTAGFLAAVKLAKKEMQFFREIDLKEEVRRHRDFLDIGLLYPSGKMPPQIPEWSYWQLLHIAFASEGFPPQVEKYKIILSCDASKIKERQFDEEAFAQWLEKFKGEKIKPRVLECLKRRLLDGQKDFESIDLVELAKFENYCIEFFRKQASFIELTTKLTNDNLKKERPDLYQKLLSFKKTKHVRVDCEH